MGRVLVVALAIASVAYLMPVAAASETLPGVSDDDKTLPDDQVSSSVEVLEPGSVMVSDVPAGRPNAEADAAAAFDPLEPCGEKGRFKVTETGEILEFMTPQCFRQLYCGSERIDDFYLGRVSGAPTGVYADYLTQFATDTITASPGTDVDTDTLSDSLLGSLGEPPDPFAMATFNWCRAVDNDEVEVAHPRWAPSFTWTTSVDVEYPIDTTVDDLVNRLVATVGLYEPQVATVPPLATGHTFVRFPTWLWVDNPTLDFVASSESDVATVQVQVRASLAGITFAAGDAAITCEPDAMLPYDSDVHHAIDDAPPCHHIFERVGEHDLTATLHYEVSERTRHRRYVTHAWPDSPWQPHPTRPTIDLTHNAGAYGVHQLLAVNVSEELPAS